MASKIEIARRALIKLGGGYNIASLDENSPEALAVNVLFDDTRDSLLRDYVWGFAKKQITPAKLAVELPTDRWLFAFTYPIDAVRIVSISVNNYLQQYHPNIASQYQQPTEVSYDIVNLRGVKVITTNQESIDVSYVAIIENTDEWDSLFSTAFEYMLASALSLELTGSSSRADMLAGKAMMAIDKAKAITASEGVQENIKDASWISARNA